MPVKHSQIQNNGSSTPAGVEEGARAEEGPGVEEGDVYPGKPRGRRRSGGIKV